MSLSVRFLLMVSLNRRRGALSFCDQKTVGSRKPASVACLVTHEVPSPLEILSDQKILHRWQPCSFEYFLVCHFVHQFDRTQMSHHEGMQLFHLSSLHCPGLSFT